MDGASDLIVLLVTFHSLDLCMARLYLRTTKATTRRLDANHVR